MKHWILDRLLYTVMHYKNPSEEMQLASCDCEAHPPSSSIHLSVMGCWLATLHMVFTSSHSSTKVTVAAKSVIKMSLKAHKHTDVRTESGQSSLA